MHYLGRVSSKDFFMAFIVPERLSEPPNATLSLAVKRWGILGIFCEQPNSAILFEEYCYINSSAQLHPTRCILAKSLSLFNPAKKYS